MAVFFICLLYFDLSSEFTSCWTGAAKWQTAAFSSSQYGVIIVTVAPTRLLESSSSHTSNVIMEVHLGPVNLLITKNLEHVVLPWLSCQRNVLDLFLFSFQIAPPEWEQKIQNTYLSIYDSLFWECKARGNPNPSYTWLKNGERLHTEVRN